MINLNDMIEAEIENGYGDANAQAKVCQDVILKAISASALSRNVTFASYETQNAFYVKKSTGIW